MMAGIITLFLFFTFKWHCVAFLTAKEENLSATLMDALNIYNRILLQEPNMKLKNLHTYKSPRFWGKATSYQSTDQIFKYFRQKTFPEPSTLIIFKPEKLKTVVPFLKKLTKMRKSHVIAKFTWLVLADSYKLTEKDENELLIPIDSNFIVTYPVNSTSYELVEIYKVKRKTVRFNFGVWHEGKLEMTNVSWYKRRNLKNETLVLGGLPFWGEVTGTLEAQNTGERLHFGILTPLKHTTKMFISIIPSSLDWIKASAIDEAMRLMKTVDLGDIGAELAIYNGLFDDYGDGTGFIFRTRMNWFIREPIPEKRADYYLQPFKTETWVLILITCIIGGLLASSAIYLVRNATGQSKTRLYELKDHFFMPMDCFCNQEGLGTETSYHSRILSFFIRFLALFIFGAYSATITSFSAIEEVRVPFRNEHEFIKNGKYSFVTLEAFGEFFQNDALNDPNWQALKSKMYFVEDFYEIVDKVCLENFASAVPDKDIEVLDCGCKVYQIETPLASTYTFAVLNKNSPYIKIINHFLLDFYSSGLRQLFYQATLSNPNGSRWDYTTQSVDKKLNWHFNRLADVYEPEKRGNRTLSNCTISTRQAVDFDDVKFEQIIQILTIFGMGMITSVVIFACETVSSYLRVKFKGRCNWKTMKPVSIRNN